MFSDISDPICQTLGNLCDFGERQERAVALVSLTKSTTPPTELDSPMPEVPEVKMAPLPFSPAAVGLGE